MSLSGRPCYHRWSSGGRCVSPGCDATRPKEEVTGEGHPSSLTLVQRGQVLELLPTHDNTAIAGMLGIHRKTVGRIRRDEDG